MPIPDVRGHDGRQWRSRVWVRRPIRSISNLLTSASENMIRVHSISHAEGGCAEPRRGCFRCASEAYLTGSRSMLGPRRVLTMS
ncbi:MAG: hypothetical protein QOJ95_5084 [Mycobacterium sp.]|jgi:hypothetical protein|nr:hypothetical protein [Mycobacterium sp.]